MSNPREDLAILEDQFWVESNASLDRAREIRKLAAELSVVAGPEDASALEARVQAADAIMKLAPELKNALGRAQSLSCGVRSLRAAVAHTRRRWAPLPGGRAATFTLGTCPRCGAPVALERHDWDTIDGQPAALVLESRAVAMGLAHWTGILPPAMNNARGGCRTCSPLDMSGTVTGGSR